MILVQLSNNIVSSWEKGRKRSIPSSPTPAENLHEVQPQFLNYTFAYFGEA